VSKVFPEANGSHRLPRVALYAHRQGRKAAKVTSAVAEIGALLAPLFALDAAEDDPDNPEGTCGIAREAERKRRIPVYTERVDNLKALDFGDRRRLLRWPETTVFGPMPWDEEPVREAA